MSIEKWISKFLVGEFDDPNAETQIEAGWYDWLCNEKLLVNKTKKLGRKLLQIVKSEKIDKENNYVLFKNNLSYNGVLYDDFRICNMKTREVIFTIVPSSNYSTDKIGASVWGKENDFKKPLVEGSWKDVKAFFSKA